MTGIYRGMFLSTKKNFLDQFFLQSQTQGNILKKKNSNFFFSFLLFSYTGVNGAIEYEFTNIDAL